MIQRLVFLLPVLITACAAPEPEAEVPPDTLPKPAPAVQLPALDSGAPVLRPVDQADVSFKQFREHALTAMANRDTAFLFSILAPEIRNSFGGNDGISGFRTSWNLSSPETRIWTVLTRILEMGGTLKDSVFTAPYVFAVWPDSIDAFEHVAVVKAAAEVRSAADRGASPTGSASYSILKLKKWQGMGEKGVPTDDTWAQVLTPGGETVWLAGADVYSPVSWRAMFHKRAGKWVMVFLVAGD